MVKQAAKNSKKENDKNKGMPSQLNTKVKSTIKHKNNILTNKIATKSSKIKLSVASCKIINQKKPVQIKPTTVQSTRKAINLPKPDVLHTYLSYSEIIQYLNYLKFRYTDFVTIHVLGYSYEKRAIKGVEINWNCEHTSNQWPHRKDKRLPYSNINSRTKTSKPAELNNPQQERNIIFIEGGTHAREWLSISVALYCIYQLTEKNLYHRDLLRKLRFFIVPLVNPDGYEYSRKTNRRWRKNRRPHAVDKYIGTDCNRNFDFHWKECDALAKLNTYQGEKPFSEPETRALAKMMHRLQPNLLLFLSLHSYAQSIMYPWGYTNSKEPKNIKMLYELAMVARKSIKSFSGRYYRVGSIAQVTQRHIGGSVVDYAYGVVKVPLAFVLELPSKEYGFQPPLKVICSLSHESWFGIRDMCKHAFTMKSKIEDECPTYSATELNTLNDYVSTSQSSSDMLQTAFGNLNSYMDDNYSIEPAVSSELTTTDRRTSIFHVQ